MEKRLEQGSPDRRPKEGNAGAAQAAAVGQYIAQADPVARGRLEAVRAALREVLPGAEERISYRMPAFFLKGKPVVYYAGFARHIGLYPTSDGIAAFEARFAAEGLRWSKGAVQFPHAKPLPLALVREIAAHRAAQIRG